MEEGKTLASELAALMGQRTQVEFAAFLGISQPGLSAILNGYNTPGLTPAAEAILKKYPELASFILPENITKVLSQAQQCSEAQP